MISPDKVEKALRPILRDVNILINVDEAVEAIIDKLDNLKVFSVKEDTVLGVVSYVDKLLKKKYGLDTIFTDFPVPANIMLSLNNFRLRTNMSFKEYREFGYWLVHTPEVSKLLGRPLIIFDLMKPELYNRFKKSYKVEDVKAKKRLHSKRIMFIDHE